jgi:twitching motility protein PilT
MAEIDKLFEKMIEMDGSDLHLKQGQPPRMRVHGHLEPIEGYAPLDEATLARMLKEITPDESYWERFLRTGDLDFAYSMGVAARFRANCFRQFFGFGAIFRIIPTEILTLDKIGAPAVFSTLGDLHSGLVLVTGPTGSGKSTTLAAIIDHINTNSNKKIITIEEPVEFVHKNKKSLIIHREVGLDTESFTSGLKGAIKSDVDIILVGEMRDMETIQLALTASEMGILVFGTLHTNSAPKTVDRIIDVFPVKMKSQIRSIMASSLKGVVSQQLLRSADGKRRYASHEVLLFTEALPGIIRAGDTVKLTSLIQTGGKLGMTTMDNSLQKLVADGKVTNDEAALKAMDKSKFR